MTAISSAAAHSTRPASAPADPSTPGEEGDQAVPVPTIVQAGADFVLPDRVTARRPWSEVFPFIYPYAVKAHQAKRALSWLIDPRRWAKDRTPDALPVRVKRHRSLLLRQLGESEMWLQHNKVTNLRLASARMTGVLIRPGETMSFNKIVGNCTKRKGYLEGMKLHNGTVRPGVGGGICQLANLLHWMVLHSALTVVERSEHSFDPFPDNGRVLPWGVGCSIVYNYVDFVVRNDTDTTFQILVGVGERYLEGELRADREQPHSYRVFSRDDQFVHYRGLWYRRNAVWRTLIDRRTGARVGEELVKRNCAEVKYVPRGDVEVVEVA